MDHKHILIVLMFVLHNEAACNFGHGCSFPCQCHGGVGCDNLTGRCLTWCQDGWQGQGCLLQENIARDKSTSQSMTSDNTEGAHFAVDGYRYYNTQGNICSRPDVRESSYYWWRVDLGDLYRITELIIFTKPYDNKNLKVFVTNSSDPLDFTSHHICFTSDKIKADGYGVARIGCNAGSLGSSVVLAREWDIMELCEVEIKGHLFKDCTGCGSSVTDATSCNHEYGCIQNCPKGKDQSSFCTNDCEPYTYGRNCGKSCRDTRCQYDTTYGYMCEPIEGFCPQGCEQWYVGRRCNTFIHTTGLQHQELGVSEVSSASMKVSWEIREISEKIQEYYGHRIHMKDLDMETDIYVNDTKDERHSFMILQNLTHNTVYHIKVFPYRHFEGEIDEGVGSREIAYRTLCKDPDAALILSYNVSSAWNGTEQTGVLYFELPQRSGCDRLESIGIFWRMSGSSSENSVDLSAFDSRTNSFDIILTEVGSYVMWMISTNNKGFSSQSNQLEVIVSQDEDDDGDHTSSLTSRDVGIAVGSVVLVVAIVIPVVIILFRRRRKRGSNTASRKSISMKQLEANASLTSPPDLVPPPKKPSLTNQVVSPSADTESKSLLSLESMGVDADDIIYENRVLNTYVKLGDLRDVMSRMTSDPARFSEEFDALPKGHMAVCEAGKLPINEPKNRYKNVVAYDHTRVVLRNYSDTDYINANYIEGYGGRQKEFIATQGPKSTTVTDFWHLVWQENVVVMVMLTPVVENLKKQCEQYWPIRSEDESVYGKYTITLAMETEMAHFTHRKLLLQNGSKQRIINHYQYLSWPDKNKPSHVHGVLDLLYRVNSNEPKSAHKSPTLVHCSAGIGRTGTYIALANLKRQTQYEDQIDVYKCVHLLRTQRVSLVQTLSQYTFLYDAILEFYIRGDTAVPLASLCPTYSSLLSTSGVHPDIVREYQAINQMRQLTVHDSSCDGKKPENISKNRDQTIIPGDDHRPYLLTPSSNGNNYINAVLLDTVCARDALVVTQVPLIQTVEDFWRLVYDQSCTLVVLLDPLGKDKYWPGQGSAQTHGKITVTSTGETHLSGDTWRMCFKLSKAKSATAQHHDVTMLQFRSWPQDPEEWTHDTCSRIVNFLDAVNRQTHSAGKTIVQCLNGASRSGIFCIIKYVIDAMTSYQEVDVSLATRIAISKRPQFIETQEQYVALYKLAMVYAQRFETYANFS